MRLCSRTHSFVEEVFQDLGTDFRRCKPNETGIYRHGYYQNASFFAPVFSALAQPVFVWRASILAARDAWLAAHGLHVGEYVAVHVRLGDRVRARAQSVMPQHFICSQRTFALGYFNGGILH